MWVLFLTWSDYFFLSSSIIEGAGEGGNVLGDKNGRSVQSVTELKRFVAQSILMWAT